MLLDMLSWGRFEPDAPLSIDGLAHQMGVSPTPVREALARLESTGLVRRTARRGYRVAPPMSHEQMVELVDARLVLETGAVERAMRRLETLRPALESAFIAHRDAAQGLSAAELDDHQAVRRYFECDWSFHQAILDHCGNRYITIAVNNLSFRVHRMRQTIGSGSSDAQTAVHEHQVILDAVRAGDAAAAVEAMRAHLTNLELRVSDDQ